VCEVCDKVSFAIETVDQLFPIDELVETFKTAFSKEPDANPRDNWGPIDQTSCRANFICLLAIRYGVKHGLNLEDLTNLFARLAGGEHHQLMIARIYKEQTGLDYKWEHAPHRLNPDTEYGS
jgi:hypothetical protein